jgi:hypothetical protein
VRALAGLGAAATLSLGVIVAACSDPPPYAGAGRVLTLPGDAAGGSALTPGLPMPEAGPGSAANGLTGDSEEPANGDEASDGP